MKNLSLALWIVIACACGGGEGGTTSPGPDTRPDEVAQEALAFPDASADPGGADPGTSDPGAGDLAGSDPGGQPDLPSTGDKPFGEPCAADAECESGLCWASSLAAGCTTPCAGYAACEEYGLLCQALGAAASGCVPPPYAGAQACADHGDCVYPTWCRADLGQCEIAPCAFDADCDEGFACERDQRRCRPATCHADAECQHPFQVCDDQGACGAPACWQNPDCAAGSYCEPTSHTCMEAGPCDGEGKCSFYQQQCVQGLCLPNRCYTGCTKPGYVCDGLTGRCGQPCTSPTDCPAGETCLHDAACVTNTLPVAVARVQAAGGWVAAAELPRAAFTLTGQASFDAEDDPLTYAWTRNAVPPGSAQAPGGAPFSSEGSPTVTPDVPGLWAFGLWVIDARGAVSIQSQVVVRVLAP